MQVGSIGRLGLVAVNFIGVRDYKGYPVVKDTSELARLCFMSAGSPLVAFVHWGEEYTRSARSADLAAAQAMHACGVNAVIGAHSHRASSRIEAAQGGEYQVTFSLGNLVFDQRSERATSALLELRLFQQGTFATRLVPMPNLFERALARQRRTVRDVGGAPEPNELEQRPRPACIGHPGSC
jgi:poly-gamma-glutamate synthesis protein (capsule biosynthesis protein)